MIFHKFHAVRTELDGIKFASKREAKCYQELKMRQAAGDIIFFLRQVPFHLSGSVKYVVDFVTFNADGTVHFIDSKGMKTPLYIAKKKIVQSQYPIKVEEW